MPEIRIMKSLVEVFLITICVLPFIKSQTADEWRREAQEAVRQSATIIPNYNVAKNVILFLGDGMGVSTVTAGRIYKGQKSGGFGEGYELSFDQFPYVGLSKTYTQDKMVSDSAATATAFLCGVKAPGYTLGVGPSAKLSNCSTQAGAEVNSILKWAIDEGKSGGIVTTTRVTHATPAAAYAHSVNRNWENDSQLPKDAKGACKDIAAQLVDSGEDIQVVLGGGWQNFRPRNHSGGQRLDNRDLIEEWKQKQAAKKRAFAYVHNATELHAVNAQNTDYLFGLMSASHLPYDLDIKEGREEGPTLNEMTEKALDILSKNKNGYFLLVEGGRIDHGHHAAQARRALQEVSAFDETIRSVQRRTDSADTLLVVSADHSHVFTMGSYTARDQNILGLSDATVGKDNKPVTTILYGNGPGAVENPPGSGQYERQNLTGQNITHDANYRYQAVVPLESETHAGEDVAIYARGPMAHLFTGVREQNYIPHAMAYAACVGMNKDHCLSAPTTPQAALSGTRLTSTTLLFGLLILVNV